MKYMVKAAACKGLWRRKRSQAAGYVVNDISCPLCSEEEDSGSDSGEQSPPRRNMRVRSVPPGERSDGRGERQTAPSSEDKEEPQTKYIPDPVAFVEVGPDGSSSHKKDKGSWLNPPVPLGSKICPICRRHCRSTRVLNKHVKEVHSSMKFRSGKCPKI